MNELKVISRRWISFSCRTVAGLVFSILPILDNMKDRPASSLTFFEWAVLFATGIGNAANTASAWFSTSAEAARKEIGESGKPA